MIRKSQFVYFGLAAVLSLSVFTAPFTTPAQAAGEIAAAGNGIKNPIADATPMPLPRFYARHAEEGNKFLIQNHYPEALDEFYTSKNINPDYYPAYIGTGDVYRKMGRLDLAVDNYQSAIRLLNPSYASDRILRGNYYAQNHKLEKAIRDYTDVLRIDPAAGDQFTLAMMELRHDEPQKAVKAFQEAIRLDDDYSDPHFQLGNYYFRDNKVKKAVTPYEEAVKIEPDNPVYRFALGTSYYKDATSKRQPDLKVVEQATRQFKAAEDLQMDLPRLHHNLGTCYLLTNNYDGAVEELKLAIQGKLSDPETFYNYGNALFRKGMTIKYTWDGLSSLTDPKKLALNNDKFDKLIRAVGSYEYALKLKPKYAQVNYDLAVAYYRLSEMKLTEKFMADMVLKDPNAQKNYFAKGVTYFPQDMMARSIQNFDEFIALSDDAKLKANAAKLSEAIRKELKDIGGKVIAAAP